MNIDQGARADLAGSKIAHANALIHNSAPKPRYLAEIWNGAEGWVNIRRWTGILRQVCGLVTQGIFNPRSVVATVLIGQAGQPFIEV